VPQIRPTIMVLQTLAAVGPFHGCARHARIEQVCGGRVQLGMGILDPGLIAWQRSMRCVRRPR